jgi:hypothetical protein
VRGQGLGNQLGAAVEEWAARQSATYIRLEVVPDNAPAIALYRRHGYVDTGVLGELLPDGDRELVMEKSFRAVGPIGATLRNSWLINSRPCQLITTSCIRCKNTWCRRQRQLRQLHCRWDLLPEWAAWVVG